MAVLIKAEAGDLLIDPKTELITGDSGDAVDFLEYSGEALEIVGANGVLLSNKLGADVVLEKLPRPCRALNCRQARSYLVKLLRYFSFPRYQNVFLLRIILQISCATFGRNFLLFRIQILFRPINFKDGKGA